MRIVLFGAAGYTGRLTAEAMVRAGLAPVLAGRHHDAVARLADRLAPLSPSRDAEPRIAVADVADPSSVRDLLESPSDVLVSTVGPFLELGAPAVEAAIDAGAAYLDSTGEPPFIRRVFDEWGPRAEDTGARLMTAFGYDYVPGNLAGALALRRCREIDLPAARVDVGYFIDGKFAISSGTRASAAGVESSPVTVEVKPKLSASVTPTQVAAGGTFQVTGEARPEGPVEILVERRGASRWARASLRTVRARPKFSASVKLAVAGSYRVTVRATRGSRTTSATPVRVEASRPPAAAAPPG